MIVYDLTEDGFCTKRLCSYLNVSPQSYYRWLRKDKPMYRCYDERLADRILALFDREKKGYRYIRDQLIRIDHWRINDKTVLRYMHILGIQSPIRKKRFQNCTISDSNQKARIVCDNVLARKFEASRPLEKLVTDVSYVYHQEGRLFISVIKDLFDNSIIAYWVSKFNDNLLVTACLDQIFDEHWNPTHACILHSDQGFQYTNLLYIHRMDEAGVTVSHSRKANCYDNACCENFFSHLKSEKIELNTPKNEQDLLNAIDDYIQFYNNDRPQRKLKGMTPQEYREAYLSQMYLL
jgi:putative transposase